MSRSSEYRPRAERLGGIGVAVRDPLLRDSLISLLEHEVPIQVVAAAADVSTCVAAVDRAKARTLLVDWALLPADEAALLPGVRAMGLKVVAIADADAPPAANAADVVIYREQGKPGLLKALREAMTNGNKRVRETRAQYGARLTPREFDVARLIAQGLPNREIAARLRLHEQSIKNLASVVMRKLQCDNRVQVALQLSLSRPADGED